MAKKDLIQKIRNEYLGLKDMPRKSLLNAIEKMAVDLYTKDTHFIFEIIQNAEDNEYSGTCETPSLEFSLQDINLGNSFVPALIVKNNEIGFEEKHVKAICQVGESSKKNQPGYIGEKGIGFKSVFRITNCPHIFSNGFQFALPKMDQESQLGYIVPEWVSFFPSQLSKDQTNIVFPLDNPEFSPEKIKKYLSDISPETIIFLSKIKLLKISISDTSSSDLLIENDDQNYPIVRIKYFRSKDKNVENAHDEELFWITNMTFQKPIEINNEKRKNIERFNFTIALPLNRENHPGKLFAFLPVWEKTGLPFLINADFLLASSREGIKEDEKWNICLRELIPEVYTEAFLSALKSTKIPFKYKKKVYASVPIEAHEPFLEPVINEIHKKLISQSCILASNEKSLHEPRKVRLASKKFRELFAKNEEPKFLSTRHSN
jgi:hypothetical protein